MRYIILCMVMAVSICSFGRAETVVSFQPATITLGESAQLIFSSDKPIKQIPDLSVLKGNFAVAGQQQRIQSVNINGRQRTQHELILNVFPRKSGEISTGELVANGTRLKPVTITVLEAGEKNALPISFQAEISTDEAYPDETIFYTVRLTDGAGLLTGQMTTPTVENARIAVLDMDKTWQETNKDGSSVRFFERRFAITPEKEGYLNIPPMELYGSIVSSPTKRSADLFAEGMLFNGLTSGQKDIRLETNAIQVKILKKPAEWKGWWLPSTQVVLSAQDTIPDTVSTGDSLTRVIRLTAMGIEADRLPTITQPTNSQFKIYPSPEQRNTVQTPVGDIQGTEEVSLIIVPKESGTLTIPAIRVPWFNTKTRKIEEAVLLEKTITVKAGAQQAKAEVSAQPEAASVPTPKAREPQKSLLQKQKENNTVADSQLGLPWIIGLTGLGILGGLGLGFLLFHHKKRRRRSYRLPTEAELKPKKKKKPLPDLYPF